MILHGGDYCPEQWRNDIEKIKCDIKLFKEGNMNCITLGMFSWSSLEPSEGVIESQWFKEVLDIIEDNEMTFILGTASAARPHWLSQQYPSTSRVNENGVRELSGKRHNHCMTDPVFREHAEQILNIQLDIALEYKNLHSIHINNEFNGYCYCDHCTSAFQKYLKKKYNTIETLNAAWWNTFWSHTYRTFSEIQPPLKHGEVSNTSLLVNWEKFMTEAHNDYIEFEKKVIRSKTDLPVTTNFCGTPFTTTVDYYQMAKHIDYISYDVYPRWNIDDNYQTAVTAKKDLVSQMSLDYDKDFYIMESTPGGADWQSYTMLKSGKLHGVSTFLQLQAGAKSCLYFQLKQSQASNEKFHGAVLDINSNTKSRVYNYVKEFGSNLKELEFMENFELEKDVAIYLSWDSFNAIRHSSGPREKGFDLEPLYDAIFEYFNNVNINCSFVYDAQKLEDFNTIIIPFGYAMNEEFINGLKELKNKKIISFPLLAYVNDDDLLHSGQTPHMLTKEFGIEVEEFTAIRDEDAIHSESYEFNLFAEVVEAKNATVVQSFRDEILKSAITCNKYNENDFYYISAYPSKSSLMELFEVLFNRKFDENDKCIRNKFVHGQKTYLTISNFGEEPYPIENCIWTSGESNDLIGKYEYAVVEIVDE